MRLFARSALVLFLGAPAVLAAQGFGVYEHSTCTMARSGTAAAKPCDDGSAVFFNPAGLASLTGNRLSFGATLIKPSGGFTRDLTGVTTDAPSQSYLVPNVFLTHQLSKTTGVGIGVFAPYGLGTEWPSDSTFEGRFLGYKTSLKSIYVQPSIGYQLSDRLQVGLGVAYIHSTVELHQRVDLSAQRVPGQAFTFASLGIPAYSDFADASLKANGNGMAVNFGAILKLSDHLSIGGHWLTRKTISYDGDAAFTQVPTGIVLAKGHPFQAPPACDTLTPCNLDVLVGANFLPGAPLSNQTAKTTITMPPQGTLGIAWTPAGNWTLLADFQYVVWGWFSTLKLDFANPATPDITLREGYRDTYGYRLGGEYRYSPKITLRGGYLYHTAAAPTETVTPLLPEGQRNEFTLGVGIALTAKLQGDLGYQHIRQNDRRGRVADAAFGNTGLYTFSAHLLAAGLAYTF